MGKNKRENESYRGFINHDGDFKPIPSISHHDRLPPGMYEVNYNSMTGQFSFSPIHATHDQIIDLPNPTYKRIVSELELFMEPETRKRFEAEGFIYKRSTLLYGAPGTGKTIISNRVANKVIELGGVVLFNPNPLLLGEVFKILDSIQPETLTMIAFEEFDQLIQDNRKEDMLLNLLDGQLQKNNMIVVATTNFIDKIPPRIKRPGRFSTVIEAKVPLAAEREFFLKTKMKLNRDHIPEIVEKTKNFSIDELKEVIVAHNCLKQPLDEIVARIQATKGKRIAEDDVQAEMRAGKFAIKAVALREAADEIEEEDDGN